MAKIHWIVYVIIGMIASIAALIIGYSKTYAFFYLGIVLIIAGIIKIIMAAKRKKRDEALGKIFKTDAKEKLSQPLRYCLKCGEMVRVVDKKCPKCGTIVVVHGM